MTSCRACGRRCRHLYRWRQSSVCLTCVRAWLRIPVRVRGNHAVFRRRLIA